MLYLSFSSAGNVSGEEHAEVLKVAERVAVVAKYGPGLDEKTRESLLQSALEMEPNEAAKKIMEGTLPDHWEDEELGKVYRLMAKELEQPDEQRRGELEELAEKGMFRFGLTLMLLCALGLFGIVTSFLTNNEANSQPDQLTELDSWGVLGVFFGWHVFGFLGAGIITLTFSGSIHQFLLIMVAQGSIYAFMLFLLKNAKLRSSITPFRRFSWAWVGRGYLLSLMTVLVVNVLVSSLSGESPRSENPVLSLFSDAPFWQFACLGLLVVLVGPFFEELMFRGWLFGGLRKRWGERPALLVSAALFALIHGDAPALPALFSLGLIFGWVYQKSGSLWAPFLVHACWNATTFSLLISVMP